jgi:hypothetical protein
MTVTNTSLLGLALPTTGTESGVWGDDVNNGLTILVDMSVAGTNNITQDSDITLAVSNGNNSSSFTSTATNSTVAQYYVLNCSGARTALRNIIVPTTSKTYVVTNGTTGGFGITVKKSGGTGVSVAAGETAIVFYNTVTGDVAKISSTVNVSSFSAGTTGLTPSTATTGAVTLSGTLATTNGGTGLTSFTANGVVYASSTSALATGSALTFDGTNLSVTSPSTATTFTLSDNAGRLVILKNSLGTGGTAEVGTTTNHDFYVRAGVSSGGLNSLYLQAGGVTGYSLNYVGVSVWSVGGSEGMRLTSTGLGIGTSSPSYKLHINGSGAQAVQVTSTSASASLILQNFTGAGNYAYIQYNGYSGSGLQFYDTANVAARMTLDSSGNLGLGVTPSAWSSASRPALQLPNGASLFTRSGATALGQNFFYNSSDVGSYIANGYATLYFQTSGQHQWFNAASGTGGNTASLAQAMTLDNSGNLLVGGTSQNGTANRVAVFSANKFGLSIIDTTAQAAGVGGALNLGGNYRSAGDAQAFARVSAVKQNSTDTDYGYGMAFSVTPNGGTFTEAMRIDSSGNVGIGTSSPVSKLNVAGQITATTGIFKATGAPSLSAATAGEAILAPEPGLGALLYGQGTTYDVTLGQRSTGVALAVLANSTNVYMAGNVGIGTSSPSDLLSLLASNSSNTTGITLTNNNGTDQIGNSITFKGSFGAPFSQDNLLARISSLVTSYNGGKFGNLTFSTGSGGSISEAMRIDSSGNLGIGATPSNNARLHVEGSVADNITRLRNTNSSPYGLQVTYTTVAPNGVGNGFVECYDTGGQRATIRSNGGLANYSANNVNLSDQREKKDIALAPNYLDKICQIPVKTFLFNDQTDTDLNLGAIAQDVQAVCPELVMESNWANKNEPEKMRLSIYQTDLQYALMKCIQELSAKVTALEAKLGG